MSATAVSVAVGVIGPTAFSLLAWGSILLVALAFGYVVWALFAERQHS